MDDIRDYNPRNTEDRVLTGGYFERVIWPPVNVLRVKRTGADGVERIAFIGYIDEAIHDPEEQTTQLKVKAPESLLLDRRPPFRPPLEEHVLERKVFDFWWKQLDYVFGLADPRSFPPLPDVLLPEERTIIERYVRVACDLAASGLLNALAEGFNVRMPDGVAGPEEIEPGFSRADLQAGFAALLRQCDSPKEPGRFDRAWSILRAKAESVQDETRGARLAQLQAWSAAVKKLRAKSLNQLLRDKLGREGLRAFEYQEEHSPRQLMSLYNYGDLLHWDDKKNPVLAQFEADPYVASDRRLAYLDAASGLAHVYIGFAELARGGVGRLIGA